MALISCLDGTVLTVVPIPVLDRDAVPYEVSLRLLRDGEPFGEVGERCGYFLAATAARLRAARASGAPFPESSLEAGVAAWGADTGQDVWADLQRYVPRDRELFCFRSRDLDDLPAVGELRATLQVERTWTESGWTTAQYARIEAWGDGSTGVRAHLTSEQLLAFLEALVQEFAAVGAAYESEDDARRLRRPVG